MKLQSIASKIAHTDQGSRENESVQRGEKGVDARWRNENVIADGTRIPHSAIVKYMLWLPKLILYQIPVS